MELKEAQHRVQLSSFRDELASLESKLAQADIEREELRKKIDYTRKIISSLEGLCGVFNPEDMTNLGFTDAVRSILRRNRQRKISATEIRDELIEKKYDLSAYSNPLSSLYTVLDRLFKAQEIAKYDADLASLKPTMYQWKKHRLLRRRRTWLIPIETQTEGEKT